MTTIQGTEEAVHTIANGLSGGGGGGGGGGGTIPSSGLLAWFDAAVTLVTSGSDITSWTSKDAGHTALTPIGTPTLSPTSINSLPAAFITSGNKLQATKAVVPSNNDIDCFVVFKVGNDSGDVIVGMGSDVGGINLDFQVFGSNRVVFIQWTGNNPFIADTTNRSGQNILGRWTLAGGTPTFVMNGVNQPITGGGTITEGDGAAFFTIGGFGSGNNGRDFNGSIAEIILYSRKLTDPEAAQVTTYLNTKYAVF